MGRRLLRWFSLVLLVLILATAMLPFSAPGTRLLAEMLSTTDTLQLDYDRGTLMGTLHLRRLAYQDENLMVRFHRVEASLIKSCLWRSEVCLDFFRADELLVEVLSPSGQEPTGRRDPGSNLFWPLPFVVSSKAAIAKHVQVDWHSGQLTLDQFTLAARLFAKDVHILRGAATEVELHINRAGIEMGASEELELPGLELPVNLQVDRFNLAPFSLDIDGVRAQHREVDVSARWSGQKLQLHKMSVNAGQWGRGELTGEITFDPPYRLSARGHFDTLNPPVWSGLSQGQASWQLQGSFADLQVQGGFCGQVPWRLVGDVDLVSNQRPFSITARSGCQGEGVDLALGELPDLEVLEGLVLIDGWSFVANGTSVEQALEFRGSLETPWYETLTLVIAGQYSEGTLRLRDSRLLEQAHQSGLGASGELRFNDGLAARLELDLAGFRLPSGLSPLSGQLSGPMGLSLQVADENSWRMAVDQASLTGEVNDLAANVQGRFLLDQDFSLVGSDFDLDINGAQLHLVAENQGTPEMHLRVADLSRWQGNAEGQLAANLNWNRDQHRVNLDGAASALRIGSLKTRDLQLDGYYELSGEGRFALQALSSVLQINELVQQNASLDLQGNAATHTLHLLTEGSLDADLLINGGFRGEDWQGVLRPVTLTSDVGSWQLKEPLSIAFDAEQKQVSLADHCWLELDAKLCLEDVLLGEQGNLRLDLVGRLEAANDLLPEEFDLEGPFQGDLRARWRDGKPTIVDFQLGADGGRLVESFAGREEAEFVWENIGVAYRGTASEGELTGLVRRDGRDLLTARISVPADHEGKVAGKLSLAQLDLRKLQPFVLRLSRLEGYLSGEVEVGGRVDSPSLTGDLTLSQGNLSLVGNPTLVEDVDLSMDFRGDHIVVNGGLNVGEGSSQLTGTLGWSEQLRLDLNLNGPAKELLYPPSTVFTVREDLHLELDPQRMRVSGEVIVPKAEIVLDRLPQGSVRISDDVVLVDVTGQPIRSRTSTTTEIDLTVRLADKVDIVGDGFNARVGGDLYLKQGLDIPLSVQGNLAVSRGRFEAIGQRLDIRRGNVSFVGVLSNPHLDVEAEREISQDQVTVGVRVGGTLNAPDLEFYSRPVLPEMEVMAYLMGGRGVDRGGDSNSLALALAMTSGLAQSRGFLRGLDLAVQGNNQNARAAVGGYVSDRIYLSYGVGLYEPVNTLTVRLDVLRNLWMEVVSSLHSSVDLYYSWEQR